MVLRRGVFSGDSRSAMAKKTPIPSAPPVVVGAANAARCTEDPTVPGRTFLPTPGATSFLVRVSVDAGVLLGSARGLPPPYSWTLRATSNGCSSCCVRSGISIHASDRIARRRVGDPRATSPAAAICRPRRRDGKSASGSRMAGCSPPAACRSRVGARDARAWSAARRSRGTPWSARWKAPTPCRGSLTRIVTRSGGRSPVAATGQNLRGSPCPSRVAVRTNRADSNARGRETRPACSMRIRETTMPASEDLSRCEKCGRALATRLRREGDRVRTYLECPDCIRPSDDRPGSEPAEPAAPPGE
jgi:hypothetical protein